ncbi:hypothetical protein [Halanaerobacter jeridensis]|uniref:Uncharacterized protein n=1 Tax=Halanaerobacter jeridensis TaxID=706427 RepID=A0A938XSK4_9FIRM|nr:hypothetical protein [Halanaerobacter jeridensis]MBM7556936.1 hypothetical protein [Halanaerobacter jeridensis]
MSNIIGLLLLLILLIGISAPVNAFDLDSELDNWWFPYVGQFHGHWDLGVGAHMFNDHFNLRNLQLRTDVDLAPGIRVNSIIRSNEKFDTIDGFNPNFDEIYIEGYGFRDGEYGKLSASLKIGKMRYLRFPEPDLISKFDHVPGTEDLRYDDFETGYNGEMLTIDYKSDLGLGYHVTGINWDFGDRTGSNWIENYLFYHDQWGAIDFESRVGRLPFRHSAGDQIGSGKHLGYSGPGFNVYLGANWRGYKAGILYENIENEKYNEQDIRTGVMVQFAFSNVTELLGKLRFDYTRSPEGIVTHIPLGSGEFGFAQQKPKNAELVGEIKAKRIITYWQNGQSRNFYEHRVSKWGNTDPTETTVVMKTKSWRLELESLVSPHTSLRTWDDLVKWEEHRQGPAQLNQPVVYKFYKFVDSDE